MSQAGRPVRCLGWWERLGAGARRWLHGQVRSAWVIDLRALALMRIGLGLLVAHDAGARYADAATLYSDAGFWTRADAGMPIAPFRLFFWSGDPTAIRGALVGLGVLALLWGAGVGTRAVTVLLWMALTSLHARHGGVLQGGDDVLRNALFLSMFLPVGARWSVDAWWRHRPRPGHGAVPLPTCIRGPAAIALYGQLTLIYVVAGVLKAHHVHWWRGEGIHYALAADHFVLPLGRALHPYVTPLRAVGVATLLLELLGPLVLVLGPATARVRGVLIIAFAALHLGIGATLRIGLFTPVCLALWCFVWPTAWMRWLEARIPGRAARDRVGPVAIAAGSGPVTGALAMATLVLLVVSLAAREWVGPPSVRAYLMTPARTLRLQDRWSLFSGPRKHSGWWAAPARRRDGTEVDLLRGEGTPLSWARPEAPLARYPNQRWRKLLVTMRKKRGARFLQAFLRWSCQRGTFDRVAYAYVRHAIAPPNRPPKAWFGREEVVTVARRRCRPLAGRRPGSSGPSTRGRAHTRVGR
ncbi:MAG: HTTM domain-containing protein [Myxococcota bacterium]